MEKLLIILGPTASGKSSLALELAKKHQGGIVSADSRQVYKEMDIGTAKITVDEGFEHHLIDIASPDQEISLSSWQAQAYQAIDKILAKGQLPILVGGTMLYLDSIIFNYNIPEVIPNENLRKKLEQESAENLYKKLLHEDLDAKQFIEPHNKRRIIRALEVIDATGEKFSTLRKRQPPRYDIEIVGLFDNWTELENRINTRNQEMLQHGLVAEVETLIEKYGQDLPLLKTINYSQCLDVISGKTKKDDLLKALNIANLQYAKKQMKWWKNRNDITWFEDIKKATAHLHNRL